MRDIKTQDQREQTAGSESSFLLELRDSFTDSFAYDLFSWNSVPARSVSFQNVKAPQGGAANSEVPEETVARYTTTASDIPLLTPGQVVPIESDSGFLPQTSRSGPLVALDDFRADARFAGIDGSGYTVAVLDTGIDLDDPFFGPDSNGDGISDRIVYQYDFANRDADASDQNGHGSNVTSIAASSDATYTGMAPGADIAALKVFTDSGSGNFGYLEDALQWVINNAAAYNIVSVNMSLSDSGNYNTPVQLYGIADELAVLASMDVIVVSASGNDFYEFNSVQGVAYPAADPNSLSVGAVYEGAYGRYGYGGPVANTTGADRITPFSQRDEQLSDIFAPGAPITGAGAGNGLATMHGTSQAAPHIAGIVALAQQLAEQELGRKLSFDEFSQLLSDSGDTIFDGDDEDDNVNNTGLAFQRVNVLALGQAILALAPPDPDQPAFFSIAATDAEKPEGDSGSTGFTFTVTRSGDTSESDSVDYVVNGSGAQPASADDFTGSGFPSGTVSFAAGETSKDIAIEVAGDSDVEENETFTVELINASAGNEIVTGAADAVIENDDAAPPTGDTMVLIDADFDDSPSDTGGFTFIAGAFGGTTDAAYTRGNATGSDVRILLGGSDGADIFDMSGGWEQTFTLGSETEVTLSFLYTLSQSKNYERDEFSQVLFSLNGGPAQVVDQIAGDGVSGPAPTTGEQSFVTSLGILSAGTHSLLLGGYNNKKTSQNEQTEIRFDDVLVTGQAADAPPTTVDTFFAIAAEDAVKSEGDTGPTDFTFTVTRTGDAAQAGSVAYAVSGGDVDASDFAAGILPGGTLSFAANETSQTLIIDVAGDTLVESDEAFTVTLSNPTANSAIATASAEGTILNDDIPDPGDPGDLVTLIEENFDGEGNTGGLIYEDGGFGGANPQSYADGGWQDDALVISLGGIDKTTVTDMSGGWTTDFTLETASEVTLSFLYTLAQSKNYETDEFSQILFSLDDGPAQVIDQIAGDGVSGPAPTTGEQSFTASLGVLSAGTHSLLIGGYNNKKNSHKEETELTIDDVLVTAGTPAAASAFAADPLAGGSLQGLLDQGISETELQTINGV